MQTRDFHYHLPAELIAQAPLPQREDSRLLCLDRRSGIHRDELFRNFPAYLHDGDLLVFNNTRVIPARLYGVKESGGKVEIMLERILNRHSCLAQVRASKTPKPGSRINIVETGHMVTVVKREDDLYHLQTDPQTDLDTLLAAAGHVPLPPYIDRPDSSVDGTRYQTVYASLPGAVAAPTAGLHFSRALLDHIESGVCKTAYITLHVGAGTFQPIRTNDITEHRMHSERFTVSAEAATAINRTRKAGGRIIAVGTTTLRCLESAVTTSGEAAAIQGETDIFIYPGYTFKLVDALVTNFHLPESTLLLLVSAFAGQENIRRAYEHAIRERYRFFSYGDAMYIYQQ